MNLENTKLTYTLERRKYSIRLAFLPGQPVVRCIQHQQSILGQKTCEGKNKQRETYAKRQAKTACQYRNCANPCPKLKHNAYEDN